MRCLVMSSFSDTNGISAHRFLQNVTVYKKQLNTWLIMLQLHQAKL